MISVVGGVYYETCIEPPWEHLLGSGGRAAFALATGDGAARLATYCSAPHTERLEALAAAHGVTVSITPSAITPEFLYWSSPGSVDTRGL